MNKVFKGKEVLVIELITMGYAAAIFGLLFFYDLMLAQGPLWIFKNISMQLTSLIILGTVAVLLFVIIRSIGKEQKKINQYIEAME
jgi:ABC-2 type transport system permease protein